MVNTYNASLDGMCTSMLHTFMLSQEPVDSHKEAHP